MEFMDPYFRGRTLECTRIPSGACDGPEQQYAVHRPHQGALRRTGKRRFAHRAWNARGGSRRGIRAEPGNGQVVLRWNAVSGAAHLEVRTAMGAGDWGAWSTVPGGAAATSHTVTSLTNGTAYTFQVRAVARHNNTDVNGTASQATATPEAPPPMGSPMDRLLARPADGDVSMRPGRYWRPFHNGIHGGADQQRFLALLA